MSSIPGVGPTVSIRIERILESAVILSWKDLQFSSQQGLIQIEYVPGSHHGPEVTLQGPPPSGQKTFE